MYCSAWRISSYLYSRFTPVFARIVSCFTNQEWKNTTRHFYLSYLFFLSFLVPHCTHLFSCKLQMCILECEEPQFQLNLLALHKCIFWMRFISYVELDLALYSVATSGLSTWGPACPRSSSPPLQVKARSFYICICFIIKMDTYSKFWCNFFKNYFLS